MSAFETKNGVRTQEEMRVRIEKYRRATANPKEDYAIGCILPEHLLHCRCASFEVCVERLSLSPKLGQIRRQRAVRHWLVGGTR